MRSLWRLGRQTRRLTCQLRTVWCVHSVAVGEEIARHCADALGRFSIRMRPRRDILLVASAPLYDNIVITYWSVAATWWGKEQYGNEEASLNARSPFISGHWWWDAKTYRSVACLFKFNVRTGRQRVQSILTDASGNGMEWNGMSPVRPGSISISCAIITIRVRVHIYHWNCDIDFYWAKNIPSCYAPARCDHWGNCAGCGTSRLEHQKR